MSAPNSTRFELSNALRLGQPRSDEVAGAMDSVFPSFLRAYKS